MLPNNVETRDYPTTVASSVTVDDVKVHLGIYGDTSQDAYLANLILSAEDAASSYIGHSIGDTTKTAYWLNFGLSRTIPDQFLLGTPVLKYYNASGVATMVDTSLYTVDTTGRLTVIRLNTASAYPTDINTTLAYPVYIEYAAGFDASQKSSVLDQAIMMYCKEMYDKRGISTDKTVNVLPLSAERLLSTYRGGLL